MSRAGTPNLPWAIPMYEGMKKSLQGNVNDASLPPRLRQAAAAGLSKLNTYYDFAQKNHFNIIATGTGHYLCFFSLVIHWPFCHTVCHPCLRVSWFRNIEGDAYSRASILFEHVIRSYEESAPAKSMPSTSTRPQPTSDGFLASIARVDTLAAPSTAVLKSEFERYALLEEGGDTDLALEDPLAWWKVSYFTIKFVCFNHLNFVLDTCP
jgi:hypothetical protein